MTFEQAAEIPKLAAKISMHGRVWTLEDEALLLGMPYGKLNGLSEWFGIKVDSLLTQRHLIKNKHKRKGTKCPAQ